MQRQRGFTCPPNEEKGVPHLGNTKWLLIQSFIHLSICFLSSYWVKTTGHLLGVSFPYAWHPNWEYARTSVCTSVPTEAGPSCIWCPASLWCQRFWQVSSCWGQRPLRCWAFCHWTSKAHFSRPCCNFAWKVIILKMWRNKGIFFPLLIPLHLSFASVRREQYTAAHKSEAACCTPHESCKCCVMPHILVKPTRKRTMLLSEHSHNQGGREKAGRFFQVRKCK